MSDLYRGWPETHALDDARVVERAAGKFSENQILLGPDVFEDTQDLDLKFLDLVAAEYSSAHTVETGFDIANMEEGNRSLGRDTNRY